MAFNMKLLSLAEKVVIGEIYCSDDYASVTIVLDNKYRDKYLSALNRAVADVIDRHSFAGVKNDNLVITGTNKDFWDALRQSIILNLSMMMKVG